MAVNRVCLVSNNLYIFYDKHSDENIRSKCVVRHLFSEIVYLGLCT